MEVAQSPRREIRWAKQSRESLTQQFPEVWAEDNPSPPTPPPRRLAKQVPLVIEVKPSTVTSAPALGLPDLAKPLTLYMTGKDKVAMGVLSQTLGTWDRPVAYLPKLLDNLATGWLGCLWAVAAVCLTGLGGNQADFGPRFDHKSPAWG